MDSGSSTGRENFSEGSDERRTASNVKVYLKKLLVSLRLQWFRPEQVRQRVRLSRGKQGRQGDSCQSHERGSPRRLRSNLHRHRFRLSRKAASRKAPIRKFLEKAEPYGVRVACRCTYVLLAEIGGGKNITACYSRMSWQESHLLLTLRRGLGGPGSEGDIHASLSQFRNMIS